MIEKLENLLEIGGIKRDVLFLVISGIALLYSIFGIKLSVFNPAWIAIVLCGLPIVLEAIIGLVTEFDIKADVMDKALLNSKDFTMIPGKGVSSIVNDRKVIAGTRELILENKIEIDSESIEIAEKNLEKGATIIYVSIDGDFVGFVALSDEIRNESPKTIKSISDIGINTILLTGDNDRAARNIAEKLGIDDIKSNCLPEDKLSEIERLQRMEKNVCMVGDGINDAPALKKSFVGIAMGSVGSDIAVDAADIALIDDKVEELPHLLRLSKRMMITIKVNLSFSMILNFVAIALAITGILNPVVGALVHNAGSVFVIINSAILLKWR